MPASPPRRSLPSRHASSQSASNIPSPSRRPSSSPTARSANPPPASPAIRAVGNSVLVVLTQGDAEILAGFDEAFAGAVVKTAVGGLADVLLLHGGVEIDPLELARLDRLETQSLADGLGQQLLPCRLHRHVLAIGSCPRGRAVCQCKAESTYEGVGKKNPAASWQRDL